MNLIDWAGLIRNALWILGLSVGLAAWSYAWWWASEHGTSKRQALAGPGFQVPFSVGMFLFCAAMAWGALRWWERGLWVVLGLSFVWQAAAWRVKPDESPNPGPRATDAETITEEARIEQTDADA